tara:strand:+ start:340 stop:801 length:462 start_codon:yes stop_codon:yes gene_type:complete
MCDKISNCFIISYFSILNCFKKKNKDSLVIPKPYYNPNIYELKEVVIVPNDKIIYKQPTLYDDTSSEEIIYERNNFIHKFEENENTKTRQIFKKQKKKISINSNSLSDIPEDIERHTPSPINLKKNNIETRIYRSINMNSDGDSSDDNWDLLN